MNIHRDITARSLHFFLSEQCVFNSAKMELDQRGGIRGVFFPLRISRLTYPATAHKRYESSHKECQDPSDFPMKSHLLPPQQEISCSNTKRL